MKKLFAAVLTMCIAAGTVSPLGDGFRTEMEANYKAALSNMGSTGSQSVSEEPQEEMDDFDKAISDLYDQSQSVTDEEILACAEMMPSDFAAVSDTLGDDAEDVIDRLKYYEVIKSDYISGSTDSADPFAPHIMEEWERQSDYTSYVMPATDSIRVLIPRIKITDVSISEQAAVMDVYEWMTVGYGSDGSEDINATAYGYNFSLTMTRSGDGWKIDSVDDTDQNFDWMKEEAEAAAREAGAFTDTASAGTADTKGVVSKDGATQMLAASRIPYSYNRDNAIAYGDKYCINYNLAKYNSYKGRGGDCANFVSQCLYAGGFPQDSEWYRHSVAWINVMKQIAHFKEYGTFLNANNGNLLKGNPIYFDWNGDGVYDHATICVGRNSNGVAILDSHTKDLYHATWTNWSFRRAATIQLRNSGTATATSLSGTWKTNSKGKYYVNADGSLLKNTFQSIDGKTYYFNGGGYLVKGPITVNNKLYFMNRSTGAMCTGWVTDGGKRYHLASNGVADSEWEKIGKYWYYFDPATHVAATGFYRVKGKIHYFSKKGVEQFGWLTYNGNKYHLDQYGVMQTGWQTIGGKKYFFGTNGVMAVGNVKIGSIVYSFGTNGVLAGKAANQNITTTVTTTSAVTTTAKPSVPAKAAVKKKGWSKENGKWYYYKNGVKKKGFAKIKNKTYYFSKKTGEMVTGWKKINKNRYYFNSKGVMKKGGWFKYKNNWYFLNKNGKMRTGWLRLGARYFYLNKNGKMRTGWLTDTDGKKYYLDREGVMVTGKRVISGKTYRFDNSGALIR